MVKNIKSLVLNNLYTCRIFVMQNFYFSKNILFWDQTGFKIYKNGYYRKPEPEAIW